MDNQFPDSNDPNNSKVDYVEGAPASDQPAIVESGAGGKSEPKAPVEQAQQTHHVDQDAVTKEDVGKLSRLREKFADLLKPHTYPDQPEDDPSLTQQQLKDALKKRTSRRRLLKGAAVVGGVAVAKKTGVLDAIGDAWDDAGREVAEQKRQEAIAEATRQAYEPTRVAKEAEDAEIAKREQEAKERERQEQLKKDQERLQPSVDEAWKLLTALQGKESIGLPGAMRLMPSALRAHDVEGVIKTLADVQNFVDYPDELYAFTYASAVFDTGTNIDKAKNVWQYADNALSLNNDEEATIKATLILRNHIEGEQGMREMSDRWHQTYKAFEGWNAIRDDSVLYSLAAARGNDGQYRFSIDEIKDTVNGIKDKIKENRLSDDVADLLGTFQLITGVSADNVIPEIKNIQGRFGLDEISATQLAVAKIASGEKSEDIELLQEAYLKKMKEVGQKENGALAASLTFMSVMNNPELASFKDAGEMSTIDFGTWYNTFINPLSPFSPFYMFDY